MQKSALVRPMPGRGLGWGMFCALGLALTARGASPATNAPVESPRANRYLLVVETSRAMESRSKGAVQAVQDLLQKRLAGELRPGDSLGVWTFNDNLYAGRFPLQTWSSGAEQQTIAAIANFLQQQKYEKKAAIEKCIPAVQRVAEASRYLTVVLISAGGPISGTAWDSAINARYAQWRTEQQRAKMPFVTVLRSEAGRLTGFAVTPVPWEIQLPPFPESLLAARQAAVAAAALSPTPAEKPPPAVAKPLIVSGKKPSPPSVLRSNAVVAAMAATNLPAPTPPSPAAASPAAAVVTQAPPAVNVAAVEPVAPAAAIKPDTVAPPAAVPAPATNPQPLVAAVAKPAGPEPPAAKPVAAEPSPTKPAIAEPKPGPAEPQALPAEPTAPPASPKPAPAPGVEAEAAPSIPGPGLSLFWLISGSLLVVLFISVWVWRARAREPGPGSLITQSVDRKKD